MLSKKFQPITNFPEEYPFYKRIGGNITYLISQITLGNRENLLSRRDVQEIRKLLEDGDILL